MRMMLRASMPHAEFNARVKNGSAAAKLKQILDDAKPEAVYFLEENGLRTAVLIVNLTDASQIPAFAEPWFLLFNADVQIRPVMIPEDLQKAGLDALGVKWG